MAVIVTYHCDRCRYARKAIESGRRFNRVRIHMQELMRDDHYSNILAREALWCDACCEEMQVRVPFPPPAEPPKIGFEELVREIVRSEFENTGG
jgi:hypothetical protein